MNDCMNKRNCIVLDCDGVLLDYNAAYREAWARAFGLRPATKDPDAYWAMDRWDVHRLSGLDLQRFRAQFDVQFWSSIPPLAGAVEACMLLAAAGYQLICLTALDAKFAPARLENLAAHGFPIEQVIAVPHAVSEISPKAEALETLQPAAFVDDFLPYFLGVNPSIHRALVLREPNGSPNSNPPASVVDSAHQDLIAFAHWWLSESAADLTTR